MSEANVVTQIESCEGIIARLVERQQAIKNRAAEIDKERGAHSYDAVVGGDAAAKKLIDSLASESIKLDMEEQSIDAALDIAKQKLEAAQKAEQAIATKRAAAAAAKLYRRLAATGKIMDEHLAGFALAASESQNIVNELHGLGFAMPSHAQHATFSSLATGGTLMFLPWARVGEYRHLSPRERRSFTQLYGEWAKAAISNIESAVGRVTNGAGKTEDEQQKEAV
jgi:hypothetical protein